MDQPSGGVHPAPADEDGPAALHGARSSLDPGQGDGHLHALHTDQVLHAHPKAPLPQVWLCCLRRVLQAEVPDAPAVPQAPEGLQPVLQAVAGRKEEGGGSRSQAAGPNPFCHPRLRTFQRR